MRLESEGQKRYRRSLGEEFSFEQLSLGEEYLLIVSCNPDMDEPPSWPVPVLCVDEMGIRLKINYPDGKKPARAQSELRLTPDALAGLHFMRP
jgi:hypothetical protein